MDVIIVGCGIAGLSAAIEAASRDIQVKLISPYVSERAQSVMAAGGINAVIRPEYDNDSIESHIQDTYKAGGYIENQEDIEYFCKEAPENIKFLEELGVVFNRDDKGNICQRAFGGQSHKRTCYSGSSTGKQIVTALVQKSREYEYKGVIERIVGKHFYSGLIRDGRCYGVITMDAITGELDVMTADSVVMAVGGMNVLFGKTTGTTNDDGYAASKLFQQGVTLRNLEFIQYHPTTIETSVKRMLITEAARGEGGRLYYLKGDKRCYFMEEKFGEKGNLMPRDVVAKCIYDCPSQVYLDITFLGEELIHERLQEIYELCMDYIDLDITKESIPVYPSVHFFMGGIAVDRHHKTNITGLYAVGECASIYHGANRLGGNSLLAAVHSGREAARSIGESLVNDAETSMDWHEELSSAVAEVHHFIGGGSSASVTIMQDNIAGIMNSDLGITRTEQGLQQGLEEIDDCIAKIDARTYTDSNSLYEAVRLRSMAVLAKAIITSALARKETRGSHIREDYPDTLEEFGCCSYAKYTQQGITIEFK